MSGLDKLLQRPEESVRSPAVLDDSLLLPLTDDNDRRQLAEITPKHIVQTLDAIVSQIRQMAFGDTAGKKWPDLTATNLEYLYDNSGVTEWTAGENIVKGQVLYTTKVDDVVRVADRRETTWFPIIGLANADASTGSKVRVKHSGFILDGFTGLLSGHPYFLGVSGTVTNISARVYSPEMLVRVGVARSPTELLVLLTDEKQRA